MASTNSKTTEQQLARQERSRAAIEGYSLRLDGRSSGRQIPFRKGQHLDVDGILARSLPQTISQLSSVKPGNESTKAIYQAEGIS